MSMRLRSDAFEDGGVIPARHTCDGEDVSPPLSIEGVPDGAVSLALVVDDPDAPAGTWVHWLLWGLPPETTSLPEGVPKRGEVLEGTRQGETDFGDTGYGGPCPPKGEEHRYVFRLYALDADPGLAPGAGKSRLTDAIGSAILERCELVGRYRRS